MELMRVRAVLLVLLATLLACGGSGAKGATATGPNTDPGGSDAEEENLGSNDEFNGPSDTEQNGTMDAGSTGTGNTALDASANGIGEAGQTTTEGGTADGSVLMGNEGESVGKYEMRYYWIANEKDHPADTKDTIIRNGSCQRIALVSKEFADALCSQGSGKLENGEVLNYAQECTCGYECSAGEKVCFAKLDEDTFPYGAGASNNALSPLRSISMAESTLPFGTVVYVSKWDGVMIPSVDGLGGSAHDGCFRVDDFGVGSTKRFNLFVGTEKMKEALAPILDIATIRFDMEEDSSHCKNFKD